MIKYVLYCIVGVLALCLGMSEGGAEDLLPIGSGGSLVRNGDCELDSDGDGFPDGWHHSDRKYSPKTTEGWDYLNMINNSADYRWEEGGYRSKECLSLEVESKIYWGEWDVEVSDVQPHTDYTLSFWYYQPERFGLQVLIFGRDIYVKRARDFRQWMYYSTVVNSGDYSGDSVIGFLVEYPKQKTKVFIDNVELYKGPIERPDDRWNFGSFIGRNEARLTYFTYDRGYISPDIVAPLSFGLSLHFVDRMPPSLTVNLHLPLEVEVVGYGAKYWSSIKDWTRLERTPIDRDGKPYTRYSIIYPVNRNVFTHPTHPGLKPIVWYLETNLEEGEIEAYFSLEWDGGRQKEQRLPLRIIRIPKAPPLKRLRIMEDISPENLSDWPRLLTALQRIGVNLVMYNPRWTQSSPSDDRIKADVERIKGAGFGIGTWLDLGSAYSSDRDSWAVSLEGEPITPDRTPVCFTDRGLAFKEALRIGERIVDSGIRFIFMDDEGKPSCFCDACVASFKEYMTEMDIEYVEPVSFERKPKDHPDLHRLWMDFGRWSCARAVRDFRLELSNYMDARGILDKHLEILDGGMAILPYGSIKDGNLSHPSSDSKVVNSFGEAFDFYGEQLYINCYDTWLNGSPKMAGDRQSLLTSVFGAIGQFFPLASAGLTYMDPMNDFQPHKVMKYQLMEILSAGVRGLYVYPFMDIDPMDMMYIAQVVNMISPVEDIVFNGLPENIADVSDRSVSARALLWGDEALVLVSDYSTMDDTEKEVTVVCRMHSRSNIIDLESGDKILPFSTSPLTFKVLLGKERARMFYVGPRELLR